MCKYVFKCYCFIGKTFSFTVYFCTISTMFTNTNVNTCFIAIRIATVAEYSYKNTQWAPLSGPGGSLLKSVTYKCLSLTCRCSVRNATGLLCFKPSPLLLLQMYSSINSKYTLRRQIIMYFGLCYENI